jgi:hypothetical protein
MAVKQLTTFDAMIKKRQERVGEHEARGKRLVRNRGEAHSGHDLVIEHGVGENAGPIGQLSKGDMNSNTHGDLNKSLGSYHMQKKCFA